MTVKKNQNKNQKAKKVNSLKTLSTAIALSTVLVGCAKDLPEKESDVFKPENGISTMALEIASAKDAEIVVKTVSQNGSYLAQRSGIETNSENAVGGISALGSSRFFDTAIVSSNNEKFNIFVEKLKLNAEGEGIEYKITFKVTENALVANIQKVSGGSTALGLNSNFLPSYALKSQSVPLFQFPIADFGVKKRRLNDLNEETRYVDYEPTHMTAANFFRLSPISENRTMAGLQGLALNKAQEIYNKKRLEQEIWNTQRARALFMSESPLKLLENSDKLRLKVYDNDLFIYKAISGSELTDTEKLRLDIEEKSRFIHACDGDIAEAVKKAVEDCFLRAEYQTDVSHVRMKLDRDQKTGTLLAKTSVTSDGVDKDTSRLIKISEDAKTEKVYEKEENKDVFARDIFEGSVIVKAGKKVNLNTHVNKELNELVSDKLSAAQMINFRKAEIVSATNGNLRRFVRNFKIPTDKAGAKFKVTFKMTEGKVVGYISETKNSKGSLNRDFYSAKLKSANKVPAFDYDISGYGYKKRSDDAQGSELDNYVFVESQNINKASHVKVDPNPLSRNEGGLEGMKATTASHIYDMYSIQSRVWKRDEVRALFNEESILTKSEYDNYEIKSDEPLIIDVSYGKLGVYRAVSKKDLTNEELSLVSSGGTYRSVRACTEKEATKAGLTEDKCYLRNVLNKKISHFDLVSERTSEEGERTAGLEMREVNRVSLTKYIKISSANAVETDVHQVKEAAGTILSLKKFKGKEFSFRRVLEDAPNVFNYAVAGRGASKWFNVEIVKFEFKKNVVNVVKARPNLSKRGTTDADYETLMSFPVSYKKHINFTEDGRRLNSTLTTDTDHNDPDAFAQVDLKTNLLSKAYSPLDNFGVGVCFAGQNWAEKKIENVKQVVDGKDDFLNYTISSIYNSSSGMDCAGVRDWTNSASMRTLKFKERVSFKLYTTTDEKPLRDISYDHQKLFNFGLFTGEKTVPKGYSDSTSEVGTTQHLPMIFDIRNGKQIEYVLAGIPADKYDRKGNLIEKMSKVDADLREKLITSTKKVIDEMNEGFARAFKGTELEGRGDVIALRIEKDGSIKEGATTHAGLEVKEKGYIGDLSRNYIYWIAKGTQSGLLGVGGPHHDPRNGFVEGASVYLYGGNMKASLDWMIESEKAQKKLVDDLAIPTNWTIAGVEPTEGDAAQAGAVETEAGTGAVAPTDEELQEVDASKLVVASRYQRDLTDSVSVTMSSIRKQGTVTDYVSQRGDIITETMEDIHSDIVRSLEGEDNNKLSLLNRSGKRSVQEQMKKMNAFYQNAFNNSVGNKDAAIAKEMYGENSPQHLKALAQGRLKKELYNDDGSAKPICLKTSPDVVLSEITKKYNLLEKTKTDFGKNDVLVDTWVSTLAHEIGHNIGLRHNFVGTFDKKNWNFPDEVERTRTSSSVMDYSIEDHATNNGLGPYDVYALRAAYTGYVELDKLTAAPLDKITAPNGNEIPVRSYVAMELKGKKADKHLANEAAKIKEIEAEIAKVSQYRDSDYKNNTLAMLEAAKEELANAFNDNMDQLKSGGAIKKYANLINVELAIAAIGNENKNTLSKEQVSSLGIKNIKFCSDEEAGDSPQCQRHDRGTSFSDIVDEEIMSYNKLYNQIYFPGNSKRWSTTGPFNYLMRKFSKLRMMNEEMFYYYIFEAKEDSAPALERWEDYKVKNDLYQATRKAKDFLISVVSTPEAPSWATKSNESKDRFVPTVIQLPTDKVGEDGRRIMEPTLIKVDTRWSKSESIDSDRSPVKYKGNEFDKAAAIFALAQDRAYTRRYLRQSLRASYLDVEKFFEGVEREDSEVLSIFEEVVRNEVKPRTYRYGQSIPLDPATFTTNVTEIMETYAQYGPLLFLDINTTDVLANPARSYFIESIEKKEDLIQYIIGKDSEGNEVLDFEPHLEITAGDTILRANAEDSYNSGRMIEHFYTLEGLKKSSLPAALNQWVANQQLVNKVLAETPAVEAYDAEVVKTTLQKQEELVKKGEFGEELVATYAALIGQYKKLLESTDAQEQVLARMTLRDFEQNMAHILATRELSTAFAQVGFAGVTVEQFKNFAMSIVGQKVLEAGDCLASREYCSDDFKNLLQGVKASAQEELIKSIAQNSVDNLATLTESKNQNGEREMNIAGPVLSMIMEVVPGSMLMPRQMNPAEPAQMTAMIDQMYNELMNEYKPKTTVDSTISKLRRAVVGMNDIYKMIHK